MAEPGEMERAAMGTGSGSGTPAAGAPPLAGTLAIFAEISERLVQGADAVLSAARLRALHEALACGVISRDAAGHIVQANRAAQEIFGRTPAEMETALRDGDAWGATDAAGAPLPLELHPSAAALRSGRPVREATLRFHRPDGEERWIQVDAVPVLGEGGKPVEVVCSIIDITARRRAEDELRRQHGYLAALHETTLGLINRLDLHDLLEAIVARVAALLGAPHGHIYLVAPDGETMFSAAGFGMFRTLRGRPVRAGVGLGGSVWQSGETVAVEDCSAWGDRLPGEDRDEFRATVIVPLKSHSRVVGIIGLMHTEPGRSFGASEIALLDQFARLATVALDNARLYTETQQQLAERRTVEAALRESEQRFRAVFNDAAIGIARADLNGVMLEANPALERMLGHAPGALAGVSFAEIVQPQDLAEAVRRYVAMIRGQQDTHQVETRYRRGDGGLLDVSAAISIVRTADGRASFGIIMIEDITARKRADERLQQLAAIVEYSNDAIVGYDVDGRITSWNPGAERLYGYRADQVLGRRPAEFPPDTGEITRLLRRAAAGETVQNHEAAGVTTAGEPIIVAVSFSPIRGANGAISGVSGIARDITARKRAEAQIRRQNGYLAALHELTLGLINRLDVNDLLEAVVQRAGLLLQAEHGFIYLVTPEGDALTATVGSGRYRAHRGRLRPGEGVGGRVWQSSEALAIADYPHWPGAVPGFEWIQALVGVPLRSGGRVVGVLGLAHAEPGRSFGAEEIGVLSQLAQLAALALDNARLYQAAQQELEERGRAEAALRESEQRFRAVFDNAALGIARIEPSGAIVACNRALEQMLGYAAGELDGRDIVTIIHPDDLQLATRQFHTRTPGDPDRYQAERRYVHKDGSVLWASVTVSLVREPGGNLRYMIGMFEDVTEHRRADETLRRQHGQLAALHETTLALINRFELGDLLEAIVERAGALLGAPHGYIYLVEPGQQTMVATVGIGIFRDRVGTRIDYGVGVGGRVWQTGEPLVVDDYSTWPGAAPTPTRSILRAMAGAPLRSGGDIVGMIGLAHVDDGYRFSSAEMDVLGQFARLASVALANARLYQAAQQELKERTRAEERLRRQNEYQAALHELALGLMNRLDQRDLLEAIVQRAAALLGTEHGFIDLVDPGSDALVLIAVSGMFRTQIGAHFAKGEGAVGTVWQTGEPVVVADYGRWAKRLMGEERDTVSAAVAVPLKSGGEVIGVLGAVRTEGGRPFDEEEVAVLEQFAELAALALDNAQLYAAAQQELAERTRAEEQLRRQNEYQAALHETTLALMNRLELGDLLDALVQRAAALLGTEHGFISLVNSTGSGLVATAGAGMYRAAIGQTFAQGDGLAGAVWRSAEPQFVPDYAAWSGRLPRAGEGGVLAAGAASLYSGSEISGVIGVAFTEPGQRFGAEQMAVLSQFARLASVALDNARLYQDVRAAEESLRRQLEFTGAITSNLGEGVLALDAAGAVTLANPAAEHMLGWRAGELLGRHVTELVSAAAARAGGLAEAHPLAAAIASGLPSQVNDALLLRRDGTLLPAGFSASPILSDGRISGTVVAFHDITERKAQTAALEHQAQHDALTNLPNRVLLHDRLEQAIRFAARETQPLALLVMDLDGFKEVNDTLGHLTGDVLLQEVARRLQGALRASDTVARLGGDEFAILLPGDGATGAQTAAQKLLEALDQPILIDGYGIDVGASVGIATYPDHGLDAQTLLRRADVAMYVAKRAKSGAVVYSSEQDQHSPDRLALLGEMRAAIESGQLVLHYQPVVRAVSGKATRAEALVRWQHPRRGLIQPDEFIPLAEQTGLINPLTRWVLATALRQCAAWRAQGSDLGVAVNLSARTLHDRGLPESLGALLEQHGLEAGALTLEITESALAPFPPRSLDVLMRLHGMGVRLAIDDFGTGYSSLAYLKRLPVDEIKLDKSFVINMLSDPNDAAIVRATIDLAHNLGLRITAEGVENLETWAALRAMGCDAAQGFYLGRPAPV